jgi:hypothetical protein
VSLEVKIDTSALEGRIKGMLAKLDHFRRVDLGMGLSEFQTDEMHRDRPFTMRSRAKGLATTKIRPHGLYEMRKSVKAQRRFIRARKRYEEKYLPSGKKRRRRKPKYVVIAETYKRWSTRPILRTEMEARLADLMKYLLEQKITWGKTSVDYGKK